MLAATALATGADPGDARVAATLLRLARDRAPGTFCPSEAARRLSDDWRPLMPRIREVAARTDAIVATQGGRPVDPRDARGPIRLALRPEPQP